ncbi:MAG: hypothetical protein JO092_05105, partial [Candidatus Eremiobacteraeota bacterium]|nr:hypothetical protein [Candidatus Eremiobacteraeota bacterium]
MAWLVLPLVSCSGAGTPLPSPGLAATSAAAGDARQLATLIVRIDFPKRKHHRYERGSENISPSTKGMTIDFTGPSKITETVGLTPSSPNCSTGASATRCTQRIRLQPCPKKGNCYTGSIATYDAVSCHGKRCTIPLGAHVLSANQDLAFAVVAGRPNSLYLTLDGIAASVALLPSASSTLIGNSVSGFSLSKCVTTAQSVTLVAVDADGNDIVGPGAPTLPTLTSDDRVHLATAHPAQESNNFLLVPPATLVSATIPNAGAVVHLTASVTPRPGSGGAKQSSRVDVTFNGDVCGVISEYPVPTVMSSPAGINPGPDGALWFIEQSGNKVGRITTGGVVTETTIPTGNSRPIEIVTGPDKALWFTEINGNAIGRITTQGTITNEFPVATSNVWPFDIIVGPDGALWFTGILGDVIGRMTTDGANVEMPVPTSFSQPYIIAAGPDNALWFTERNGNKVARVTTAGAVTEWTPPTSSSGPTGIATGPDGNLWFAEGDANKIARMTSGAITEFPVPTAGSLPLVIVPGPDGALWFTECLAGKIARITTAGAITEY